MSNADYDWGQAARRSLEFGLGATIRERDQFGNASERSAILAVGGKRDGNQARMLPPIEDPPSWDPDVDGPATDGWTHQGLGTGHDTRHWDNPDVEDPFR
jgi:hypothetical protein